MCLANGAQGCSPVFDNLATWFYNISANNIYPSWIGKRLSIFEDDFDDLDFLHEREKACYDKGALISQINHIFELAF